MTKTCLSISLLFLSAAALADPAQSSTRAQERFWTDVRDLVSRCSVQEIDRDSSGRIASSHLRSSCAELEVRGATATFTIEGETFVASMTESTLSDDGDLWNVYVQDSEGRLVATRTNVLAFGDILLALAGGEARLDRAQ
jgi:hypothetical protein